MMAEGTRRKDTREAIAKWIIAFSGFGLIATALVVIISGIWLGATALQENTRLVFNALLPLFGTWVGAVIAFYFSRENFEAASQSVSDSNKAVRDIATQSLERLRSISVRSAMIPRGQMKVLALQAGATPENHVKFKTDVVPSFQGQVTRLPVLSHDDKIKYIIHESMAYKFISDRWRKDQSLDENATLADFLAHDGMGDFVSKAIAFVAVDETLATAKTKMDQVPRCQDVIVTEAGEQDETVLGWLTNVDIAKHSRA